MAGGDPRLPVDELIDVIKNGVMRANVSVTDPDRDLQVASVHLKLNTIATAMAGGGLDFRIPFVGIKARVAGSVVQQTTHAVEMMLVPDGTAPVFDTRNAAIEDVFVDAIDTVRAVVACAAEGDDRFVLKDSIVELPFGVTEEQCISLGVEEELKYEITHTMSLSLSRI